MPTTVSEIASGAQFSRSISQTSAADAQTRSFRILLSYPGESVNLQEVCGIYIGDAHPVNTKIVCLSFDARYDGDSRMAMIATFNYTTLASSLGSDDGESSGGGAGSGPTVRPANWTTGVATYESPVRTWRKVTGETVEQQAHAAENPAGDMYDGLVKLEPIVTISITQPQSLDPLANVNAVGCINSQPIRVGRTTFGKATVMLRSIQSAPVVEPWGSTIFRGWTATYEFLYKKNPAHIYSAGAYVELDIGWDIAVPQSGFNVKAFTPGAGAATRDPYGQPLKHINGKIAFDGALPVLPNTITDGDKVRGMIKVFDYENGGASQVPSAQPIALNDDGTPRIDTANPKVLVYRYRVYKEYDFNTLGLRLI